MITQYQNSNGGYSLPGSSYVNYFKNYIMPTDNYLIMQDGQYSYVCLVDRVVGDDYLIRISRSDSYSSLYTTEKIVTDDLTYTVYNDYYVYSNLGIGNKLDIDYSPFICGFLAVLCGVLAFNAIFGGVLLRRKKRV